MKRIVFIVAISSILLWSACSEETREVDEDLISTESLWSGFSIVTEEEMPPTEPLIFLDKSHLESFALQHFPSSWGEISVSEKYLDTDYSKEAIIYGGIQKAKPFRASSVAVKGYRVENNSLVIVLNTDANKVPGVIDIQESLQQNVEIIPLHLDIVQKEDLPKDLKNIYQP